VDPTHDTTDPTCHDPDAPNPAKGVDLPPYGPRNPDPITDAPGAHPIETGIGATIGGAAGGLVAGVVGGPLGAVVGAIAGGAVVGGLAGKGVGELIDPTAEDEWVRGRAENPERPATEAELAAARRAFRFGLAAQARFPGRPFREVEDQLHRGWQESGETVPWADVYESAKAGFDRPAHLPTGAPD